MRTSDRPRWIFVALNWRCRIALAARALFGCPFWRNCRRWSDHDRLSAPIEFASATRPHRASDETQILVLLPAVTRITYFAAQAQASSNLAFDQERESLRSSLYRSLGIAARFLVFGLVCGCFPTGHSISMFVAAD
jgi:hypothetical protein